MHLDQSKKRNSIFFKCCFFVRKAKMTGIVSEFVMASGAFEVGSKNLSLFEISKKMFPP